MIDTIEATRCIWFCFIRRRIAPHQTFREMDYHDTVFLTEHRQDRLEIIPVRLPPLYRAISSLAIINTQDGWMRD